MPPEIITLLAIVGLFVYACFGGVVATMTMRLVFDRHLSRGGRHALIRGIAGDRYGGNDDVWFGFVPLAIFWPLALSFIIVFAAPIWITYKVAQYVAGAQLKEVEA
jgi:hypothetical protein